MSLRFHFMPAHHFSSLGSPQTRIGLGDAPATASNRPDTAPDARRRVSQRAAAMTPGASVAPGARPLLAGEAHPGGQRGSTAEHRPGARLTLTGGQRSRSRLSARAGFVLALAVTVALTVILVAAGSAKAALPLDREFGPLKANPADGLISIPLDDLRYDRAKRCVKQPTKGAAALVKWLPRVSPRGTNWGINRCEKWGKNSASVHAEGRAVDWHLDAANKADRAEAERLIRLLLAPDANGEPHALARRLGVQGLIWDCRAWWGGGALRKYSVCTGKNGKWKTSVNKTLAHRDHIHIELSKPGAALKTSWWRHGTGRALARAAR